MSELQRTTSVLGSRGTQTNSVSNEQKALAILNKTKANAQSSNMARFEGLIAVYLGVDAKIHYPKLLDADGNKIKETVNGRTQDKRSETSDGWTHYFNELGTGKIIQVVLKNKNDLKLFGLYSVSGMGYDVKAGNMFFIEKETSLSAI
ncbi:TPA: hypothetical protein TY413_002169 [Streptococcus suis]|nr:hypothetical protein [Streptococcus suis]